MDEIKNDLNSFLDKLFESLSKDNIDVSNFELDHVCYRAESMSKYESIKNELVSNGQLVAENEIRGRKIAIIELSDPLVCKQYKFSCIEVSSPREDLHFTEGLEHAEFVLNESFDSFMAKYPDKEFNLESIKRKPNPEVIRQYIGYAAKFHHKSLLSVVLNLD